VVANGPWIPFRFGERGELEITVFELGHASGAFDEHHAEQAALPGRKPTVSMDDVMELPIRWAATRNGRSSHSGRWYRRAPWSAWASSNFSCRRPVSPLLLLWIGPGPDLHPP
jgi:hypothetical protein